MSSVNQEDRAVTTFREYLRIKTVQPNPDYPTVVAFLKRIAGEIGLPCKIIEVHPGRDIVVITWEGLDPSLPSIMLNSHTDVVPVFPEEWKYPPFDAHKDEKGDIYARGTQDMKCVGMQHIEAVRKLKQNGVRCKRTIHVTFVPDEEIGGFLGMNLFIKHEEFKKLNVDFALDEGLANPTNNFTVYYGERSPWWVRVTCHGNPGHGSRFIENTAAEKLRRIINSFLDFRAEEEKRLKTTGCLKLGDVTTVNMTMLEGGIQCNVVPNKLAASFDIRIPPTVDMKQFEEQIQRWCQQAGEEVTYECIQGIPPTVDMKVFEEQIQRWCQQAGEEVTYECIQGIPQTVDMKVFEEQIQRWCQQAGEEVTYECIQKVTDQTITSTDDSNKWWKTFSEACDKMGMTIEKEIFPASTDIRYLREIGLPALGFSPMNNTPILLHDHNEMLNENVFLKGIDYFCGIIPAIANLD